MDALTNFIVQTNDKTSLYMYLCRQYECHVAAVRRCCLQLKVQFYMLCTAVLILILIMHYYAGVPSKSQLPMVWTPPINLSYVLRDNKNSRIPLNLTALEENFARVKEITKSHSNAKYRRNLDIMMMLYAPVFSTDTWRFHSPGERKNYTVKQLQDVFVRSLKAGFLVPNIAHVILFNDTELKFYQMVDILSCIHVMKPDHLLLWYAPGKPPKGKWWEKLKRNLSSTDWENMIIMAQRSIPTYVYSIPLHVRAHQSDVIRMEAVLTFGGFYMDLDTIVLKPLDALRKYPCTLGRELSDGLSNGEIFSAPNSTFLAMWYTTYQVFDDELWAVHSVNLPHSLQQNFPDLCHVEEDSMNRPNWTPEEINFIYETGQPKRWDWKTKNYVMHLWRIKQLKHLNMETIKSEDSIYGQMSRFILYGTS